MDSSKNKVTSKEFIGREDELSNLRTMLEEAANGNGNLALIQGEAGVGKTRLVSELVEQLKAQDIQYLHGKCRYHQGLDPYSPFIEALRSWFGIMDMTKDKKIKDRIGKIIRTVSPELIGIIPLIRGFLSAGTTIHGSYLFKGGDIDKSYNTFKELVEKKKTGLCITREHPKEVQERYNLDKTKFYWLSRAPAEVPTLEPLRMERIRLAIKDFISENKDSVVILDGLEYLILQNNFENVFKFVELLKDDIALNDAVLILPLKPTTLEDKEMALLERYMRVISSEAHEHLAAKKLPGAMKISIPEYAEKGYPFRSIDIDYMAEKDKMFKAILQLLKNISQKKTLILFLDDLHWADCSSLQLLKYLFQNSIDNNILIICAYRPEDLPAEEDHIQEMIDDLKKVNLRDRLKIIELGRLDLDEVTQQLQNIVKRNVPVKFLDVIFKKSEGNPLYVEEILKSLINRDLISLTDTSWHETLEISEITIPDSITDVVQMRLDILTKDNPQINQILNYISVIGKIFDFEVLFKSIELDEEPLLDNLETLIRSNIIHEIDVDRYKFDHTVIREVIYTGLGSRRKKILHEKIGDGIEQLYEQHLKDHYAELAHHFSNGGVIDKAVFYSIKEGETAKELCAYDEALFHYRSALDMLTEAKEATCEMSRLINIYINLGDLTLILGNWADAKSYFENSLEISKEFGYDLKKMESQSKLTQIEVKRKRWSFAEKELEHALNLNLDGAHGSSILVTIKPRYIIRTNISLIKLLLKEDRTGVYICINHPSTIIDKLLRTHDLPTQNLVYLDFITPITGGIGSKTIENAYIIDEAFSLNGLLNALDINPKMRRTEINFDPKKIDFILVDNISNLVNYTTQEKIQGFIKDLVKNIKNLSTVYGIVIMDDETSPETQELLTKYFDDTVPIKKEWL